MHPWQAHSRSPRSPPSNHGMNASASSNFMTELRNTKPRPPPLNTKRARHVLPKLNSPARALTVPRRVNEKVRLKTQPYDASPVRLGVVFFGKL